MKTGRITSLGLHSIPIILIVLILNGCSLRQNTLTWVTKPMLEGVMSALMAETDIELARTALESELKLLDGFLEIDPQDRDYLLMATQGYTGYAMLFLEEDEPQRALIFYERARKYGMKALAPGEENHLDELPFVEFNDWIGRLKISDLPIVYWTATAWAGRINLDRTSVSTLAEMPRALGLMQWVLDRDPHYYYSGPLWFFGVYYASLPPMMGGGSERATSYFDSARAEHGTVFQLGNYLFAKNYCTITLNRELFTKTLNEVIVGIPNAPAELNLANSVAAERARKLLTKTDEIF